MQAQGRPGIEMSVTILVAIILALTASALLLFLVGTSTHESSGFLEDAEGEVESSIDEQKSGVREKINGIVDSGVGDLFTDAPC